MGRGSKNSHDKAMRVNEAHQQIASDKLQFEDRSKSLIATASMSDVIEGGEDLVKVEITGICYRDGRLYKGHEGKTEMVKLKDVSDACMTIVNEPNEKIKKVGK